LEDFRRWRKDLRRGGIAVPDVPAVMLVGGVPCAPRPRVSDIQVRRPYRSNVQGADT
jgi:hypothetical protein